MRGWGLFVSKYKPSLFLGGEITYKFKKKKKKRKRKDSLMPFSVRENGLAQASNAGSCGHDRSSSQHPSNKLSLYAVGRVYRNEVDGFVCLLSQRPPNHPSVPPPDSAHVSPVQFHCSHSCRPQALDPEPVSW